MIKELNRFLVMLIALFNLFLLMENPSEKAYLIIVHIWIATLFILLSHDD